MSPGDREGRRGNACEVYCRTAGLLYLQVGLPAGGGKGEGGAVWATCSIVLTGCREAL